MMMSPGRDIIVSEAHSSFGAQTLWFEIKFTIEFCPRMFAPQHPRHDDISSGSALPVLLEMVCKHAMSLGRAFGDPPTGK